MYPSYKENTTKVFYALVFLLFIFGPIKVHAAALSVSPSSGTFEVGNRVTVKVLATSNVPFNAISGVVSIPQNIFSIESVSKSGSVLNFWVTEPVIQAGDAIKFEGVALGGFSGSTGTVINVNLRATKPGTGAVSFKSGQILANDGEGTDITGNLVGAAFTVKEATTKPTTTPTPTPTPAPEVETPQPAPTLTAPEIVLGTKYGAQAILGTSSYGRAQTIVTFMAEDGTKIFILGVADTDGSFNLLVPNSLKRGLYTVTAVMVKDDKTNSEKSNVIFVEVGSVFSDIGWQIWFLIILLILAIIYLILRINHHIETRGAGVDKRKLHEAQDVIHKSFDLLREDMTTYDKDEHTLAEHRKVSGIKKDISDAERIITKEIKDIE